MLFLLIIIVDLDRVINVVVQQRVDFFDGHGNNRLIVSFLGFKRIIREALNFGPEPLWVIL